MRVSINGGLNILSDGARGGVLRKAMRAASDNVTSIGLKRLSAAK